MEGCRGSDDCAQKAVLAKIRAFSLSVLPHFRCCGSSLSIFLEPCLECLASSSASMGGCCCCGCELPQYFLTRQNDSPNLEKTYDMIKRCPTNFLYVRTVTKLTTRISFFTLLETSHRSRSPGPLEVCVALDLAFYDTT